jgi:hypothetical protein
MVGEPTIIDVKFVDKGSKAIHQTQITSAPTRTILAGERTMGDRIASDTNLIR